jgi:MoaA/NifB/PqqE/SkfB family radical SAM enzyme
MNACQWVNDLLLKDITEEYLKKKVVMSLKQPYPRLITWYITSLCDYSCPICFTKDLFALAGVNELPYSEIIRIFDDVLDAYQKKSQKCEFIISGGEPFMRPDIFEILDRLDILQCSYRIGTNLNVLDTEGIFSLASKRMSVIGVSLHFFSKNQHKVYGSYNAIRDKLNILRKYNSTVKIVLCIPIIYLTPDTIHKTLLLAKEIKAQVNLVHLNFADEKMSKAHEDQTLYSLGEPASFMNVPFRRFTKARIAWFKTMSGLLIKDAKRNKIRVACFPALKEKIYEYYLETDVRSRMRCSVRGKELRISAQGIIFPCLQYPFGDLRRESFAQILDNKRVARFDALLRKEKSFLVCRHCNKVAFSAY